MSISTALLGPLVVPECRRAAGRVWIIVLRTLTGITLSGVALSLLWFWWFQTQLGDPFSPYGMLRGGLIALEIMAMTLALVLSPAVLAGSLAGERERGSLGLLLTTRVNALEIVAGRLFGKLSQVGMALLAGVPAIVLIASLAGLSLAEQLVALALPIAVGFGGGGIALGASAVSRRGRDALLVVYFLDVLFLMAPLLGRSLPITTVGRVINFFNPFEAVYPLAWNEDLGPALTVMAIWLTLGALGVALASWRLRPVCLRQFGGEVKRGRAVRRWWVPPVGDRPMLWKELHIERVGSLGRFGKWIGVLLVLALGLGSTTLAAIAVWGFSHAGSAWDTWAVNALNDYITGSAVFVGFLIQWIIGLRAGVAISSERERGSWDALLTSPLDGGDIVLGKLWGSLYALKWLLLSAVWAWTLTFAFGAMEWRQYLSALSSIFIAGAFMAAVGVRASLATNTATRSMAVSIGIWLAALAGVAFLALIVVATCMLLLFLGWLTLVQVGLVQWSTGPWFPMGFGDGFLLTSTDLYLGFTLSIVSETRLRFDHIAGRMAGGTTQVAVERLLHGRPMAPIPIELVRRGWRSVAKPSKTVDEVDQPEGAIEPA